MKRKKHLTIDLSFQNLKNIKLSLMSGKEILFQFKIIQKKELIRLFMKYNPKLNRMNFIVIFLLAIIAGALYLLGIIPPPK